MKKKNKSVIKVTVNGPYIVTGLKNFKNSKGENIPIKSTMALCRCGQSSTKPVCNGTHLKIKFKDKKKLFRTRDKVDVYKGKQITIYDNRGACSHRGYCSDQLPSVWRTDSKPWIDPDGAAVEEIIKICEKCPSGALSYSLPEKERVQEIQGQEEKISISPRHYDTDGPYDITGSILLNDPKGSKPESKEHYTLCRCGASKNKPFCNGQHWHIKFIDNDN